METNDTTTCFSPKVEAISRAFIALSERDGSPYTRRQSENLDCDNFWSDKGIKVLRFDYTSPIGSETLPKLLHVYVCEDVDDSLALRNPGEYPPTYYRGDAALQRFANLTTPGPRS